MEIKATEDIGEEIISRLKELIAILERKIKLIENEKKFPFTNKDRN